MVTKNALTLSIILDVSEFGLNQVELARAKMVFACERYEAIH
jgi:hypothetical protein